MAVAFDAASTGFVSGASSLTISHTVGSGSNRALVVAVTCINSTDYLASATATYGGVSMGSPVVTKDSGTSNNYVYVWVLANPASGTANVVVTPSGSAYLKAVVSSYTGVDQTTPVSATAKYFSAFAPSPKSTSITVASGGMAVDFICDRNSGRTITPDATQTRLGSQINGTLSTSSGSYKADATAMQWTHNGGGSENVAIAVVALAPASAGGITGTSSITLGAVATAGAGIVVSGIVGTSAVTLGSITTTGAGTVTGAGSITGSSSITLGAIGTSAAGRIGATLTVGPFKNKSGTVLASQSIAHVVVLNPSSRAVALSLASQSTDGSGYLALSSADLVPGSSYMVASWNSDGSAAGNSKITAAV